jgi:hypothetical protein
MRVIVRSEGRRMKAEGGMLKKDEKNAKRKVFLFFVPPSSFCPLPFFRFCLLPSSFCLVFPRIS